MHLDITVKIDLSPCETTSGLRVFGNLVRKNLRESPAVEAVHKLKEKVSLFALGTVRIANKCLGHGLKGLKESEINGLADSNSYLKPNILA